MSNQKYFDVPWAFGGDQTVIPDPLQTGGTVSFTEGWNYNYQRDLATDPAALPIDRSTTNYLFNTITAAIAALQSETVPEFILASQNGGTAVAYGTQAVVLWSASGNAPFTKFVNITGAANSNTPSVSDPLGATTGWQIVCDPISTSAQAAAGTNNASIMTPLLVAQQTALRALLAGNATQVFNVGPATAAMHAAEATQVQANAFNYAGAAGGTGNALTATLAPAPTSYTDNLDVIVRVANANSGATTLAVNGLAATAVVGAAHVALQGGELAAGGFACFVYSASLAKFVLAWTTGGAEQIGNATQPQHAMAAGQAVGRYLGTQIITANGNVTPGVYTNNGLSVTARTWHVRGTAGGGGSGGSPATSSGAAAFGTPGYSGAYAEFWTTAAVTAVTVGAAGTAGVAGANSGGTGGNSTWGSAAILTLTGGTGGQPQGPIGTPYLFTGAGSAPVTGTLSPLVTAVNGSAGSTSIILSSAIVMSGQGGDTPIGRGGLQAVGNSFSGQAATGYGGGGGGSCNAASQPAVAGGAGHVGVWIVDEYA